MAREWIKITLSYLFLHILAPLHCRERNTRSSRIEAEPCTQVPRQKCALDAHSAPHGMTALPEVQRQQWVGMRLTSLRVHRRKAVVEVSLPGSSRSSPSTDDPLLPFSFDGSCQSTLRFNGRPRSGLSAATGCYAAHSDSNFLTTASYCGVTSPTAGW